MKIQSFHFIDFGDLVTTSSMLGHDGCGVDVRTTGIVDRGGFWSCTSGSAICKLYIKSGVN